MDTVPELAAAPTPRRLGSVTACLGNLEARRLRAALLLAPLMAYVFLRYFTPNTDPDYWWHVRTGRLIWESGGLPLSDPYSFTAYGQPWVMHEWLSELLLFAVAQAGGYVANVVLFGLLSVATWSLVYATCRLWGSGELPSLVATALGVAVAAPTENVRPQMLTMCLLALTLFLVSLYRLGRPRALWPLPPLFALWVNLHGGYAFGLGVLALVAIGCYGNRRQLRALLIAVLLSLAATLLNPHGPAIWTYPVSYLGADNASQRWIQEWRSPDFDQLAFLPFALSLLLAAMLGWRGQPLGLAGLLPAAALAFVSLQAARNLAPYAVASTPLLAGALQRRFPELAVSFVAWPRLRLLALVSVALAVVVVLRVFGRGQPLQLGREPLATTYPVGAVAYLHNHSLPAPLFNDYGWGGFLIHELYPQRRVFVDGRIDVYGYGLAEEYMRVHYQRPGWRAVLEKHGVDLVLAPKDSPLAGALAEDAAWTLLFEGDVERLYGRR